MAFLEPRILAHTATLWLLSLTFQVSAAARPTNRRVTLSYEYTLRRATVRLKLMTPPLPTVATERVVKPSDKNWLDYIKDNGTILVESKFVS